jgi:Protein of unknown function (DUF3987)/Phage integrase family
MGGHSSPGSRLTESAARASELLGLDVGELDLANRRAVVTSKGGAREWITWSTSTARLLPRLLKGRHEGPVVTTRAPSRVVVAKLDQAPGATARLSYRRAEELFKAATGSTLHQLRHSALTHLAGDGASAPMLMTNNRGLADRPGFRGRGLLARFLYSLPASLVGHRQAGAPPVPPALADRYAAELQTLAASLST